MTGRLLEIEDLTVSLGPATAPVRAVRGVSFGVPAGQTTVVLGESGSGKSMTARAVLGLLGDGARTTGDVRLDGESLLGAGRRRMRAIRGRAIGLVPQDPNGTLDPLRRVGAQLEEVLRTHQVVDGRTARRDKVAELLREVGIPNPARVSRSFPHEISGGMRQRVAIAMAVACSPRLLIADEPTTALDMTIQAQVLDLFRDLQAQLGMALLLVTHDVGVAREMGSDVVVMYAGRIVEEGPVRRVLDHSAHPYTAALLGAQPRLGVPRGQLAAIPGRPPAATDLIANECAFAARCPHVADACTAELPIAIPANGGGTVACPIAWPSPDRQLERSGS